jgi:hypothetical protein
MLAWLQRSTRSTHDFRRFCGGLRLTTIAVSSSGELDRARDDGTAAAAEAVTPLPFLVLFRAPSSPATCDHRHCRSQCKVDTHDTTERVPLSSNIGTGDDEIGPPRPCSAGRSVFMREQRWHSHTMPSSLKRCERRQVPAHRACIHCTCPSKSDNSLAQHTGEERDDATVPSCSQSTGCYSLMHACSTARTCVCASRKHPTPDTSHAVDDRQTRSRQRHLIVSSPYSNKRFFSRFSRFTTQ